MREAMLQRDFLVQLENVWNAGVLAHPIESSWTQVPDELFDPSVALLHQGAAKGAGKFHSKLGVRFRQLAGHRTTTTQHQEQQHERCSYQRALWANCINCDDDA